MKYYYLIIYDIIICKKERKNDNSVLSVRLKPNQLFMPVVNHISLQKINEKLVHTNIFLVCYCDNVSSNRYINTIFLIDKFFLGVHQIHNIII